MHKKAYLLFEGVRLGYTTLNQTSMENTQLNPSRQAVRAS